MEEFITEIQNGIKMIPEEIKKQNRYRGLFAKIISTNAEVKIINKCDEDGDIVFEVPMKSVGITYSDLLYYKEEIASEFVANFIGEIAIRENMDKFAILVTDLKDNYLERVNKFIHRKFGMKIYKDSFVLRFHASLIQSILLEDFKKTMV